MYNIYLSRIPSAANCLLFSFVPSIRLIYHFPLTQQQTSKRSVEEAVDEAMRKRTAERSEYGMEKDVWKTSQCWRIIISDGEIMIVENQKHYIPLEQEAICVRTKAVKCFYNYD